MNHAIKFYRLSSQKSPLFCSSSFGSSLSSSKTISRNSIRSVQVASGGSNNEHKQSNFHNMDKTTKAIYQEEKTLNVMEESFGEGYSTRSDDEGFGGVYGGNDECNSSEYC